jgi:hypothetical protein
LRNAQVSRSRLAKRPLFLLFLQEINSEGRSVAAEILNTGPYGKRNNSGTTAHVIQPIYLLNIFSKIAHLVKPVKRIWFIR